MNTYDFLAKIDLQKLYAKENDELIISELEIISENLKNYLLKDFDNILNEPKEISLVEIEYENPNYRQSATGFIYKLYFLNEDNFKIHIEILIDFQRILISAKGNPKNSVLKKLDSKINSTKNYECNIDLKEI